MMNLQLTCLDALATDKILSFLSDDELRAFHQVSKACRRAVEEREIVNQRRIQLVEKIRENKENLNKSVKVQMEEEKGKLELSLCRRVGTKPGATTLVECQNFLDSLTPNSNSDNSNNNSINQKDGFVTPNARFPFQILKEADKSVEKRHNCVTCLGPVPSPLSPIKGCGIKLATRCRLNFKADEKDLPKDELVKETDQDQDGKHPKTPSHIISSDSFSDDSTCVTQTPPKSNKLSRCGNEGKGKGKAKVKFSVKKTLRRLARL